MASPLDSPGTGSLPTLREFLHTICENGLSLKSAGAALEVEGSSVEYWIAALHALGLARVKEDKVSVTKLGGELLRSGRGSPREASVFRRAIEASKLHRGEPDMLGSTGVNGRTADSLGGVGGSRWLAMQRGVAAARWNARVVGPESRSQSEPSFFRYEGRGLLRRVEIDGFKAFAQRDGREPIAVETEPLTVLVGPNGTGKSTILQALDALGMVVRGTISELLQSHGWVYKDLPHLLSDRQTFGFVADVELGSRVLRWSLMLGSKRNPGIANEKVEVFGEEVPPLLERTGRKVTVYDESLNQTQPLRPMTLTQSWLSTLDPKEDREAHPGLLALRAWAERIFSFWSLDPALLRSPSSGAASLVGPRGGNLASFLGNLKRRRPEAFETFVNRVATYYPRLRGIDVKSDGAGQKTLSIEEAWNGAPVSFNANQVSDGLLRLLAVASIPHWEHPPSVVLLDEIENGLHPRLIGGIAQLLEEISQTTQVIATTHSPITLNYVPAECTRLVTRGRGGAVTITNLTDTNGYAELREHFEPGELWYNVGEERLVGPAPKGKGRKARS